MNNHLAQWLLLAGVVGIIAIFPTLGYLIERRRKAATATALRRSTFGFPSAAAADAEAPQPAVHAASADPWHVDNAPLDPVTRALWERVRKVLAGHGYTFADYLRQVSAVGEDGAEAWLEWRSAEFRLNTRMDIFARRIDTIGQRISDAYNPLHRAVKRDFEEIMYHTSSWMTETGQYAAVTA